MKKLIIGVLVVVLIVCIYFIAKNASIVTTTKPAYFSQAPSENSVAIDNWIEYSNPKNGLQFLYPSGFTVEPDVNGGYPEKIEFKPDAIKLGSFFTITIYDLATATSYGAPITTIDSVPQTNYNSSTPTSVTNVTVGNLSVRLVKQANERSTATFLHGQNAYRIDWSCWPQQPCYNDQILNKLVNSISFTK